tara:strand:- start:319 stop:621 length:303 start_codon:yes stop_codon:yes gene_type:complete
MCSEIEIGDLVCLADDEDFMIGIGIVIDVASDSMEAMADLFDITEFDALDEFIDTKLYLHKPVYLVLWSGDKNYFSDDTTPRPLWFFKNELKLVNKATKD